MNFTLLGTILVSFSACNGILSNIYDEPETAKDFGFIAIDRANHSGTVRVDRSEEHTSELQSRLHLVCMGPRHSSV